MPAFQPTLHQLDSRMQPHGRRKGRVRNDEKRQKMKTWMFLVLFAAAARCHHHKGSFYMLFYICIHVIKSNNRHPKGLNRLLCDVSVPFHHLCSVLIVSRFGATPSSCPHITIVVSITKKKLPVYTCCHQLFIVCLIMTGLWLQWKHTARQTVAELDSAAASLGGSYVSLPKVEHVHTNCQSVSCHRTYTMSNRIPDVFNITAHDVHAVNIHKSKAASSLTHICRQTLTRCYRGGNHVMCRLCHYSFCCACRGRDVPSGGVCQGVSVTKHEKEASANTSITVLRQF